MQKIENKRNGKLYLTDGSIELLKWFALILMTGDHINKYLLNSSSDLLFSMGRLVLPIFVFVLAYNLTRSGVTERHYLRAIKRMIVFGVLTTPAFVLLGGDIALVVEENKVLWRILNVLFTLALLTWCLYAFKRAENEKIWLWVGWASFWLLGVFVEFWWGALGLGVSIWWYYKNIGILQIVPILFFSLFFLLAINQGNAYFLVAFPVIFFVSKFTFKAPRMKWFFYFYYPAHLTIIYAVKELV